MAGEAVEIFDREISLATVKADSGSWEYRVTGLTNGSHVLTANGSGEKSNPWTFDVTLQNLQLSIREAPDNVNLDPLAVTGSLTAVLNYDMQPNDRLRVTWTAAQGTPAAGSHTTNTVVAGSTRPREIALPIALVAFSLGKTVEVTFTFERGVSPPVPSQPLPLNVLNLPASAFTAPVITQANGTNVLDLNDVTAGATLLFSGWPLIASGQRTWLDLEGEDANGDGHNLTIWTGTSTSVYRSWATSNSYRLTIAFSYLQQLRDGSRLFIRFRLNMDRVANPATAVVFETREYTIRSTP